MLASFDRRLQLVTAAAVILLMATMSIAILVGVFSRYVLNDAVIWSEELARYAQVWVSFLGGGLAFRRGGHIAVEFVVERLPEAARRIVLLLGQLGVLFFLIVLAWKGAVVTEQVALQTSAAMRISMSWPYLALPVGAVLMIYHLLMLMLVPGGPAEPKAEMRV